MQLQLEQPTEVEAVRRHFSTRIYRSEHVRDTATFGELGAMATVSSIGKSHLLLIEEMPSSETNQNNKAYCPLGNLRPNFRTHFLVLKIKVLNHGCAALNMINSPSPEQLKTNTLV